MGIVSWIIFGAIAGYLAKFIMPGKKPKGILITVVLGIGGAIIGGYIATALGIGDVTGFNVGSLVIAVGGAIVILWFAGKLR